MSEPLDATQPSSQSVLTDLPDAAWELPELAVVAILASMVLFAIAGAMAGIFFNGHFFSVQNNDIWVAVLFAVRWVDLSIAALLLGAIAICWWQYGQWTTTSHPGNDHAVVTHVRRLQRLTHWLRVAFVVVLVASVTGTVASIVISTWQPTQLSSEWTSDIQTILTALAVDVILIVGFVAVGRVFNASSVHLARFDPLFSEDTEP